MCKNHKDEGQGHCHCQDGHGGHCHGGDGGHCHGGEAGEHGGVRAFMAPAVSLAMLAAGMLMSHLGFTLFTSHRWVQYVWYLAAFMPVGVPVVREAAEGLARRDWFNEFTLMVLACVGAFCIGELPEAVGVMLFYSIGETLQDRAVDRARRNIAGLLDVRGESASVLRDGIMVQVDPRTVHPGDVVEVRPGERVPLDGVMETDGGGAFDTSALTGESVPRDIDRGGEVLAGMISSGSTVRLRVTREYSDSTLSRILDMVGHAASRKARTELFIRRFARVYTPVVMALAALVVAVPAVAGLLVPSFHYVFADWLYRALVFLVISCPCALVVSVPLGYFAGIGAASRAGILFKGGNYLEAITHVDTVAFDKTGTLTTGRFGVETVSGDDAMLGLMAAAEAGSSHPLARALVDYVRGRGIAIPEAASMSEQAGHGTVARVDGHEVVAGNLRLLDSRHICYPAGLRGLAGTMIACAVDGRYAGYVTLADTLKPDAADAVSELRQLGVKNVVMLSGDRRETVAEYARRLGIHEAHGEMLPQDKAAYVEGVARTPGRGGIAFVGDGMNDAPVLALSDVGVAMGGIGSDAAIESADVVIQTDSPARLATAIRIGRATHAIVTENIVGAIAIKVLVLGLGAAGYASLWAAVFADVGVALLAVLNSMRIMWRRY